MFHSSCFFISTLHILHHLLSFIWHKFLCTYLIVLHHLFFGSFYIKNRCTGTCQICNPLKKVSVIIIIIVIIVIIIIIDTFGKCKCTIDVYTSLFMVYNDKYMLVSHVPSVYRWVGWCVSGAQTGPPRPPEQPPEAGKVSVGNTGHDIPCLHCHHVSSNQYHSDLTRTIKL